MSDIAIRVENLSKLYHIGALQQRNDTLRDALVARFRRANQSTNPQSAKSDDTNLWALRDVSFEVKRGEVVGIIGRNGAGKSTLLKILSRITEPTSGLAEIHGRVGSLLEVGTGFHPELTGRENIYLNGAILGMRRTEIDRQFDEIVAFAEIERFLDTPVKRYSSGMYVRLAFAVAAHLEPEILLVDEVLAVGDAAFQKKCLGKMEDVAQHGRTVLFVSHNMQAIAELCPRAIWVQDGRLSYAGGATDTIAKYLRNSSGTPLGEHVWTLNDAPGDQDFRLLRVRTTDIQGNAISIVDIQMPFYIEIEYMLLKSMRQFRVFFILQNALGQPVLSSADVDSTTDAYMPRDVGHHLSRCELWSNLLKPGDYDLTVGAVDHGVRYLCNIPQALRLQVTAIGALYATDWNLREGSVAPRFAWMVETVSDGTPQT